ncbi:MAG TPA: prenyltransferase/squalene oxidase repeat-containing protein [Streptosporangiaceae bacterium]
MQRTDSSQLGALAKIDLILLTQDGAQFVLRMVGGQLRCFRLTVQRADNARDDMAELVRSLARRQLGIEISYLGMMADAANSSGHPVVAASTRSAPDSLPDGGRVRVLSYPEVMARRPDVPHSEYFDCARSWLEAESHSATLGADITRAIEAGIAFVDAHLSIEERRTGWNLYLDGSSVGLLSTAEGILAHLHGGINRDIVPEAVATLIAMQNPDGGWRIRSSLVGAHSDASITESTCECLWALHEAGRSDTEQSVRDGIAWLESQQRADGGWASSGTGAESLVFPTTTAVRALAKFRRTDAVAKGIAWLRRAQHADGGWGPRIPEIEPNVASSAAYTAYAVVALAAGHIAEDDRALVAGCEFLRTTFNPAAREPWEPIAFTSVVDNVTHARMDYRHFTTPWAIAALCQAGSDLAHSVVFKATLRLLELQKANGTWNCGLNAPSDTTMWTIHDAIFGLRAVQIASIRNLRPVILSSYLHAEREAMRQFCERLLVTEQSEAIARTRRSWLQTSWMSALTVGVIVIILFQTGLFRQFESESSVHKTIAFVVTALVTTAGAVVPALIAQEYQIRRNRSIESSRRDGGMI